MTNQSKIYLLRCCAIILLSSACIIGFVQLSDTFQISTLLWKTLAIVGAICVAYFCWRKTNDIKSRHKTNFYKKITVDFSTGSSAQYVALASNESPTKQQTQQNDKWAIIAGIIHSILIISWIFVLYSSVIWLAYLIYINTASLGVIIQTCASIVFGTLALYFAVYLIPESIAAPHKTSKAIRKYKGPHINNEDIIGLHYTKVLKMRGFKGLGDLAWHHEPASREQITILERFGIVIDQELTRGEAAYVIEVLHDD